MLEAHNVATNNKEEIAEVEEKPKRRTRRRVKTVESDAPEASADAGAQDNDAAAEEAEKPARATRTRKASKVKKPDDAEAVEESKAAADGAEADKPEADVASDRADKPEKPARTRRKAAKAASDSSESAENTDKGDTAGRAESAASEAASDASEPAEKADSAESDDKLDRADAQGGRASGRNNRNQRGGRHNRRQRNAQVEPSVTREELAALKVAELRERAGLLDVDFVGLKKAELVEAVYDANMKAEGFLDVAGVLDILADGYGFLRTTGYLPGEKDCYVGMSLIKRNGLRKGDYIEGSTRPARDNEKFAAIQKINTVNGIPLEELSRRPKFADLTPIYPSDRLLMEHGKNTTTARVIDLVAPIGKGQRGLIVSPPKAGKTTILKDIAAAIHANNPEVHLMCLLVDERPEEVTDMQRSIHGEVISSTFDMPADNHIAVAEMVIERAKRLVETGKDVVILLDSITRLARAYNLAQPASGRVLSGGVDSTALYPPKRFLGAARNIEDGGSLTILASALIETGSKMDEVIFEEFKGTGNMELRLDRQLADRRIFPAIDPVASGTRKEELLLDTQMAPIIWAVRRILANTNNTERAMDMLIKSIKQTDDNNEFLLRMARKAQHGKSETLEF